jgi:hypothetical protein
VLNHRNAKTLNTSDGPRSTNSKMEKTMQLYRIRVLLAFGVLFALAGCKSADVAPRQQEQPAKTSTASSVVLNIGEDDKSGHDPGGQEVHTAGLAQNSVVTWHYQFGFTIDFKNDVSPCNEGSPIKATKDTASLLPQFTATCTIKNPPSATPTPYHYLIDPDGDTIKGRSKAAGRRRRAGSPGNPDHCEGCVIDN